MHAIRLRGPWECEPLERDGPAGDLPPAGKTTVPGDWSQLLGDDFVGRVRYTRRFNAPTNLGPSERVWLVVEGVDHEADVLLNGRPLGTMPGPRPKRFDITALVEPHNVLHIEVRLSAAVFTDASVRGQRAGRAGGVTGEVRLEIV
jgi:beta-galactosidase/beta-glucuronidase